MVKTTETKERIPIENTNTRDNLAKDRTHLANERTFLAYGRTALGIGALAVIIFKFTPTVIGVPLGVVTTVLAFVLILYGVRSYRLHEIKIDEHSKH